MRVVASKRVKQFLEDKPSALKEELKRLKEAGIELIDLSSINPTSPTPGNLRNYCKRAIDKRRFSGFPKPQGTRSFRKAVAEWATKRFNVSLNSKTDICATSGTSQAIFEFTQCFVNANDYVISLNPGVPFYREAAELAGAKNHLLNLNEKGLPDLKKIPAEVAKKAKIFWINYPHNPTGALAPKPFLKELVEFRQKNDIILASDETYSELYYKDKPISALEVDREGVVVFNSVSLRSLMPMYRVGWVAGDEKIIEIYKTYKKHFGKGPSQFTQDAASAAYLDESHVENFRNECKSKRNILVRALTDAGLPDCSPQGAVYIWQKAPEGMLGLELYKKLLAKSIITTPGKELAVESEGENPGKDYVRISLLAAINQVKEAAEIIQKMKF